MPPKSQIHNKDQVPKLTEHQKKHMIKRIFPRHDHDFNRTHNKVVYANANEQHLGHFVHNNSFVITEQPNPNYNDYVEQHETVAVEMWLMKHLYHFAAPDTAHKQRKQDIIHMPMNASYDVAHHVYEQYMQEHADEVLATNDVESFDDIANDATTHLTDVQKLLRKMELPINLLTSLPKASESANFEAQTPLSLIHI